MNAWVALVGAVAGATIAFVGQLVSKTADSNSRRADLVLEQCASLVSLSEDFRNRYWEESQLGLQGRVDGWDIAAHRLAEARLKILCRDAAMLAALDELTATGKALGGRWRRRSDSPEVMAELYAANRLAVAQFVEASTRYFAPTRWNRLTGELRRP